MASYLKDSYFNNHKFEDLCEEAWIKSFSSVTKQNLNSEIKEKKENDKIKLIDECTKSGIDPHLLSLARSLYNNKSCPKPNNFIDNKPNPSGVRRSKISNEALGTQTRQKSVGRAAFLQKLEKNSSHNQVPGAGASSGYAYSNERSALISDQLQEVLGDPYSDSTMRQDLERVLGDSSGRDSGVASASGEGSELEAAFEGVTLEEGAVGQASGGSSQKRNTSSSNFKFDWEPLEELSQAKFFIRDQECPPFE